MSWLDRIKDKMKITTGDGVDHFPDWMNASFVVEYKLTEFNFIEVKGGLVKRKKAIGTKYNMELYFQGPDHRRDADRFKTSTDNTETPWILEHPLYDLITVQPTSLNFDNSQLNVTKITGTVIETMEAPPLNNYADPMDTIPFLTTESTELAVSGLTITPTPGDVNTMKATNNTAFKKGVPIISDALDFEKYNNAFNTAATYIDSATATPILAMRSMTAVLQLPGQFNAGVAQRLKVLIDTFNTLRNNLVGLFTVPGKQIFAGQQCALVSAMCYAASTPLPGNYSRSSKVLEVIELITSRYGQFVEDMDIIQSGDGGSPLSFVADSDMIIRLNELVNFTITNLFTIALGAKQERSLICEKDTNIFLLTHRIYGLDPSDKNINQLIDNNDLSLYEYIGIPKGRKIVYYV